MPCEATELVKLPPIIIDEVSQFVTHYTQIKACNITHLSDNFYSDLQLFNPNAYSKAVKSTRKGGSSVSSQVIKQSIVTSCNRDDNWPACL